MEKAIRHASRHGSLALSIMALAGLALLSVQLWSIAAGYVLLLLVPALLTWLYQVTVTRDCGLVIDAQCWRVMTGTEERRIPTDRIAYLRVTGHGPISRSVIVLLDGREVSIPFDLAPDPLELIRAATDLGVPVRSR
ncbi:hypothetical protein HKCCSP123_15790 [Rhodobacterales bacterium HKCCSP123]|nr:hypothetical protein [Rhodobacterales bacterium HKCCSP123]